MLLFHWQIVQIRRHCQHIMSQLWSRLPFKQVDYCSTESSGQSDHTHLSAGDFQIQLTFTCNCLCIQWCLSILSSVNYDTVKWHSCHWPEDLQGSIAAVTYKSKIRIKTTYNSFYMYILIKVAICVITAVRKQIFNSMQHTPCPKKNMWLYFLP